MGIFCLLTSFLVADLDVNLCLLRMYLCDDVLTWGAEVLQNMYCALVGSWNLVVFVMEKLEIALSRDTHCTRHFFF